MSTRGPFCLSDEQIEQLALGDADSASGDPDAPSAHLAKCESCRERVRAARDDLAFLTHVRDLAQPQLGPAGAPRIPGYSALEVISSGAQGVVYRARQDSTQRQVAIKTLFSGTSGSMRQRMRAEREAEIAARLRHPNVVTVFESRTLPDGRVAVIMEYIDGVPLDEWQAPGAAQSERQRSLLRVFVSVCTAVHHAHMNGVIHRDLKPDNILVTGEGRPVILDFGIAKARGTASLRTTVTGEFAGTPAYASPEQASGRSDHVDALTDIYSLGVILYRLLCGELPYALEGSLLEVARTITETPPTPPRHYEPSLHPDLEAIVLRALRKDKHERYESAAAMARDIERYLEGQPVEARSGSGWYLVRKAVAANRRGLIAVSAGTLVIAAAGGLVLQSRARARDESRRAEEQSRVAREQSARARAVTELLREALPDAPPQAPEASASLGAAFSKLYMRLETGEFASDPVVDQSLRTMWAQVYTNLGTGKAVGPVQFSEVSLRNGLMRLRAQHGAEHEEIAENLHHLAGVVLVRHRAPEAESICREALEMRARLLGENDPRTAETRSLLARILHERGNLEAAQREARKALRVFDSMPRRSGDVLAAPMLSLLARAAASSGHGLEAEPLLRDALTRRLRHLIPQDPALHDDLRFGMELTARLPDTPLGTLLRSIWTREQHSEDDPLQNDIAQLLRPDRISPFADTQTNRTPVLQRLLALQERCLGTDDPAIISTLLHLMRSAGAENRHDARVEAALRAARMLSAHGDGINFAAMVCYEDAAIAFSGMGRCDEAVEASRSAGKLRERVPPAARDSLSFANARRLHAWFLTLAGRHAEAMPEHEAAVQELTSATSPTHHVVALAESAMAFSLAELGGIERADEVSARALRNALASPATFFDQLAHVRLARGHVLAMKFRAGKATAQEIVEAQELLHAAWTVYERHTTEQFPWHKVILADMQALGMRDADAGSADNPLEPHAGITHGSFTPPL